MVPFVEAHVSAVALRREIGRERKEAAFAKIARNHWYHLHIGLKYVLLLKLATRSSTWRAMVLTGNRAAALQHELMLISLSRNRI